MARTEPEKTDDGRYIIVNGRRWRATDPAIPNELKDELVRELMRARRAIKDGDETARASVHAAKTALGERGEPWWEQTDEGRRARAVAVTITLLKNRDGNPVLVSDIARVVGGTEWHELVDLVADAIESENPGDWVLEGKGDDQRVLYAAPSEC